LRSECTILQTSDGTANKDGVAGHTRPGEASYNGASLPIYSVLLKGVEVRALFDTGATRSFLNPLWLTKLGLTAEDTPKAMRITCANGTPLTVKTQCLGVPIRIGTWEGEIDLLVAEMSHPLLIGFDFIKGTGLLWDVKSGELTFPRPDSEEATYSCNPFDVPPKPVSELPEEQPQVLTWGKPCEDRRERRKKKLPDQKKPFKIEMSEEKEKTTLRGEPPSLQEEVDEGIITGGRRGLQDDEQPFRVAEVSEWERAARRQTVVPAKPRADGGITNMERPTVQTCSMVQARRWMGKGLV
ncbi:reverse, partial [Cystoisospora suis]